MKHVAWLRLTAVLYVCTWSATPPVHALGSGWRRLGNAQVQAPYIDDSGGSRLGGQSPVIATPDARVPNSYKFSDMAASPQSMPTTAANTQASGTTTPAPAAPSTTSSVQVPVAAMAPAQSNLETQAVMSAPTRDDDTDESTASENEGKKGKSAPSSKGWMETSTGEIIVLEDAVITVKTKMIAKETDGDSSSESDDAGSEGGNDGGLFPQVMDAAAVAAKEKAAKKKTDDSENAEIKTPASGKKSKGSKTQPQTKDGSDAADTGDSESSAGDTTEESSEQGEGGGDSKQSDDDDTTRRL